MNLKKLGENFQNEGVFVHFGMIFAERERERERETKRYFLN
jgi:hypothetical protein